MSDSPKAAERADLKPELRRLVELVVALPEIGPPLASLAFKVGHSDIAEQIGAMAQEGERAAVEFHYVAAHAARREKRFAEALAAAERAIAAVAAAPLETRSAAEDSRLLHLVRLGFAIALFDLEDVGAARPMARALLEAESALEPRLAGDAFYRTLRAQALWFEDREASEAEWERAAAEDDVEATWNARGTWYKDAEADAEKAEKAYREGLERAPDSPLLLHNVAQLLVARAGDAGADAAVVRRLCNQADELLRRALRQDTKLRRHIHSTRDRLFELRRSLPAPAPNQARGPRSRGGGGGSRERSGRGAPGEGARGPRGGEGGARGRQGARAQGRRDDGPRDASKPSQEGRPATAPEGGDANDFLRSGKMSLGDLLRAKLEEKKD